MLSMFSGDGPLVMRIHAYLDRYGYINFGVFKRLKPLPGIFLLIFLIGDTQLIFLLILFRIEI